MTATQRLPRYVFLLLLGQAINLSTAVLTVTVAPLVGLSLAPNPGLATIPYGMQFLAILLSTLLFAKLMNLYGRYVVFVSGVVCLMVAGIVGYLAISQSNFWLFCLAQFLIGLFISTANFYRFAATDGLAGELVSRASTMVIAGGVIAAIVGPSLAMGLQNVSGFATYSAIYLSLVVFAVLLFCLLHAWHGQIKNLNLDHKAPLSSDTNETRESLDLNLLILLGILAGATSYFLMNLMMIASSLHLKMHHSFHYASFSIQLHVLAMFLPSFFVSFLIKRSSKTAVNSLGFWLIALSCLLPLLFSQTLVVNCALIILGVGWNFAYSSATAIIGSIQGSARIRIQGINETVIALMATLGAFLPGPLVRALGWEDLNRAALLFTVVLIVVFALLVKKHRANSSS